jgi:hypothetical protein
MPEISARPPSSQASPVVLTDNQFKDAKSATVAAVIGPLRGQRNTANVGVLARSPEIYDWSR